MPLHHVTDFDRPDRLDPAQRAEVLDPAQRAEVLAAARDRVLQLDVDPNGNVHRREVLDALDDDEATA